MQACWLMLRWNRKLGGARSTVEFVQGDGGLGPGDRCPLRPVPVDTLAQFGAAGPPPPAATPASGTAAGVRLEELAGAPYDALRQKIDQAAMLGLPILLQGERGTGKTFLARYYHERRSAYRRPVPLPRRPETRVPPGEWLPLQAGTNQLVTVTLSEFGDLDNLRDTLFG
jgi:hypothetical protein